jgi:hypothetical protein
MQTYEAALEFWHRGELIQPGRTLTLSEREARYHLLNGELKPAQTVVEAAPKRRNKAAE